MAELARLRGLAADPAPVISLERYAKLAQGLLIGKVASPPLVERVGQP